MLNVLQVTPFPFCCYFVYALLLELQTLPCTAIRSSPIGWGATTAVRTTTTLSMAMVRACARCGR